MKNIYLLFCTLALLFICNTSTNAQWQPCGLSNLNVDCLAISGQNIFAGSNYNDVFSSSNNGASWERDTTGFGNAYIYRLAILGNSIFAGTNSGIFVSTDSGAHWEAANNGLECLTINSFAINGGNIFAATPGGVFLSSDTGRSWSAIDNGMDHTNIQVVAIAGTNVFAGEFGGEIFLSTNNGTSWKTVSGTGNPIVSFGVSGTNIFTGIWYDRVYVSTDTGKSWMDANNGLPLPYSTSVWSFCASGTNIFAGTLYYGVFLSTDTGKSWNAVNYGLTDLSINTLALKGTDMFASTAHGGLFKRSLSDMLPCRANFSISADTAQLHHYIVTNYAYGNGTLSYVWSWGDGTYDSIPYPSHTYADSGFYDICLSITDSMGCQSTFCDSSFHAMRTTNTMVYVNVVGPLITGTQALNSQTSSFTIYPNPATNQLTIHTSSFQNEAVTVSVMNVLGQMASPPAPLSRNAAGQAQRGEDAVIDISKLPAGMYFLQLRSENGSVVKKFVKE